ncbi:MAG TPA: CARDB domain-containing protein [Candidatus Paceibacterota bacterium]|nr:CARDB domain-containing protein [Candidatus Paceibacterota bacterium]
MNGIGISAPNRTTTVYVFAVIGFVALVGAGMWLAVYSTRYVPSIVNRFGSAAVYLGSVFTPAPSLSVVPTASTTIPFGEASSSISTSITSPAVPPAKHVPVTAGAETSNVFPLGTTTTAVAVPNGLPDLITTINAIGYLATSSANSFVASSTVPAGSRPAVTFTIKNAGTGVSGPWRFSASIPTQTAYIYRSQLQQPLNPGDSIDYTLGFDQANKGAGQTISITANYDHLVTESNFNNNSASATTTILGS